MTAYGQQLTDSIPKDTRKLLTIVTRADQCWINSAIKDSIIMGDKEHIRIVEWQRDLFGNELGKANILLGKKQNTIRIYQIISGTLFILSIAFYIK